MWGWFIYFRPWQAAITPDLNHLPDRLINRLMNHHLMFSLMYADLNAYFGQRSNNHRLKATTSSFRIETRSHRPEGWLMRCTEESRHLL